MTRWVTWRLAAMLGCALAIAGTAWANGDDFFDPAPSDQPIDLVFVGYVRDKVTKQLIKDSAYITVDENFSGMTFPFTNDKPGHFRSPDIGVALSSAGAEKRDEISLRAVVAGYKNETVKNLPRKTKGVVEITFFMERDGTPLSQYREDYYGTGAAARTAATNPDAPSPLFALLVGIATIIVLAGGRTLALRRSTAR